MSASKRFRAAVCALLLAAPALAVAQSTDAYHAIQVFPVVVDTGSYKQRFNFRGTQQGTTTVGVRYFPAEGTSQATPLDCPTFEVPWGGKAFASLRAVCPALAAGSQFGFLVLTDASVENRPFTGFSRVSSSAGIGFSVEAFPAHTFTGAFTTVAGLRRLAATSQSPAYQSNCFVGLLNEATPRVQPQARVVYGLLDKQGAQLGDAQTLWMLPGTMRRVLDVFGSLGVAATDVDDATFVARPAPLTTPAEALQVPPIIAFCTVQENTGFSADFRIGKQEFATRITSMHFQPAAQDQHVLRDLDFSVPVLTPGMPPGALVSIDGAQDRQHAHALFFRQPDWVSCRLEDPFGQQLPASFGLEMRLAIARTTTNALAFDVVAGGSDATGFGRIYLGDKRDTLDGANTHYILQVENNESVPRVAGARGYHVRCHSGSGALHGGTAIDLAGVDQF